MEPVATRLPGVTFRTEVPPPPGVLPRMDVAGFVGLASSGPIGVPVPVEDPGRFRDVFGPALPLAWDADEGRMATAFLTPAVEAFFRNGGRRCWVLREARGARRSTFPVPTLLDAETGRPALARARSAGSWADRLRVGTVLDARTLSTGPLERSASGVGFTIGVRDSEPLRPGDVLQATIRSGDGDRVFVLPILAVDAAAGERRIRTGPGRVFRHRVPSTGLPIEADISIFGPDAGVRGTIKDADFEIRDGVHILHFDPAGQPEVAPGDVLHAELVTSIPAGQKVWLAAGEVETVLLDDGSRRTSIRAADALWPHDLAPEELDAVLAAAVKKEGTMVVHKLSLDLVVWDGEEVAARLGGLGLAATEAGAASAERLAARFWADLPTDETLFRLADGEPVPPAGALHRAAFLPRFPLAGPDESAALYVPLAMPTAPAREAARAALEASPATALERDGLEGFSPRWFLDAELAERGVRALPGAVLDKLYLREPRLARQRARWPLAGIHAFWPLDDITIVAAPDAVQPGWVRKIPDVPAPIAPPDGPEFEPVETPGGFRLKWEEAVIEGVDPDHVLYELEASRDPTFAASTFVYRGSGTKTYVYFGEEGPCGPDLRCLVPRYYRVRVRAGGRISPYSETLLLDPAPVGFRACRPLLGAPVIERGDAEHVAFLSWNPVPGAGRYHVEASADPAFGQSEALGTVEDSGAAASLEFPIILPSDEPKYYRVRAERLGAEIAESGPWSNTVTVAAPAPDRWTMCSSTAFDVDPDEKDCGGGAAELLAFHRGVLRFCTARADVTALLALPAHYRTDQAAAHMAALRPPHGGEEAGLLGTPDPIRPLSLDEEPALSYGAFYHPWLGVRDESARVQPVRFLPPDGAIAGMVAARSIARGAWVAPANVALRDVVALSPAFDELAWARLLYGGLNLIRPLSRGFGPLSAETLAGGVVRPLNVRRLMILLRRLALREGQRFVFDSNSAALRRRITIAFEGLMTRLFERGAFAGSRPGEAFQVRADGAVNPAPSVDRGRLIVELRVAPSQPLAFLSVRLVHLDGVGLTAVEA